MNVRDIFIGLVLAAAAVMPTASHALGSTKLFDDSTLVVRDRFSDEIVGQGPDVIFIPGLASSRATWSVTAKRLKAHYRLHLIQVAGFAGEEVRGNASGPVLAPTAEAIDAYLVEQHLTPAVVVGHSLGGTMVLYLAEHHADHLKKIMIVDALPFYAMVFAGPNATVAGATPTAEQIRTSVASPPNQAQMLASLVTGADDRRTVGLWGDASDHGAVNRALADDLELDLRPGLSAVTMPVTMLYPDNVPNGAPAAVMDGFYGGAYAALPAKTLVRIDNSRHFIMLDQPDVFAAALDAFLAK
jgi:pimeloyl-[acyl-carrier protein] methyl ester esterase